MFLIWNEPHATAFVNDCDNNVIDDKLNLCMCVPCSLLLDYYSLSVYLLFNQTSNEKITDSPYYSDGSFYRCGLGETLTS